MGRMHTNKGQHVELIKQSIKSLKIKKKFFIWQRDKMISLKCGLRLWSETAKDMVTQYT